MIDFGNAENADAHEPIVISELISYRIGRVSSSLSRSAASRYRRNFDVSLPEWRTIALLGEHAPMTVNRLARRAGLDKARMSRVVAGLHDRGLVTKTYGGGRTTEVSLTVAGRELYAGLIGEANDRDERIRRHLGPRDLRALQRALDTLANLARVIEEEEEAHRQD